MNDFTYHHVETSEELVHGSGDDSSQRVFLPGDVPVKGPFTFHGERLSRTCLAITDERNKQEFQSAIWLIGLQINAFQYLIIY